MSYLQKIARRGLLCRLYGAQNVALRTTIQYRSSRAEDIISYEADAALPFKEIPGPRGLPFIGTALEYTPFGRFPMKTKMRESCRDRRKTYGKIYREQIGPKEFVFISDPKDIGKVFRNEGSYPIRSAFDTIITYRRQRGWPIGLANLQGEEWHRVRSSVQKSMMRPKTVGAYASLQDEVSRDLVDVMRALIEKEDSGGQIDSFRNYVYRWALESISVVVLDKRLGCVTLDELEQGSDAQQMIEGVNNFFSAWVKLEFSFPLYKYISTPTWRKFEKAMDQWHTVSEKLLKEKLAKSMAEEGKPAESETDFLQSLLSRKDVTFEEAMLMAVDLLAAGIDTTGHTLMFNLFCLAKHPEAQDKLYQEIMEVIPPGQPVDDKMLNKMHYLRAVVKETFRMYPTANANLRILNEDITLSGYVVPANTVIMLAHDIISSLPECYPEPEIYRPERWLRDDESSTVPPFALLPFGYGPRMCIGRRFAEQEMHLALIRILQNFHVGWEGDDMKQENRMVNAPDRDSFVFLERTKISD